MNIKLEEDNGKDVGMVNVQDWKFWRFSSNEFWTNVVCLVLDPNFGLGGLIIWYKEKAEEISGKNRKRPSIRAKVYFYEVFIPYIIYCLLFYITAIITPPPSDL